MAETTPVPDAWVGEEVHVRYVEADAPRSLNNGWGVCVAAGDGISFFPSSSVVRTVLGITAWVDG